MKPREKKLISRDWGTGKRSANAEVQMTQRNIKTIMAAIALIMASGVVQAAPYGQNYLSPPSHRLAYAVACEWVRDYRGKLWTAWKFRASKSSM